MRSPFLAALLVPALLLAGCAPSLSACAPGDLRVGLVTDLSGIDGTANALVWEGLERADEELPVCAQFLESRTRDDYRKNLTALVAEHFELIVASPALSAAVEEMAARYPDTHFLLVDSRVEPVRPNVHAVTFRVDQAAFPAGYLAAAWADLEDSAGPWVGYVASRLNPYADRYVAAFRAGVEYFNRQKQRSVGFRGAFVGVDETFEADEQANALIDLGADVILDAGDGSFAGALSMAMGRGRWGIGTDLDRAMTNPELREILLTCAVKHLDQAAFSFLEQWTAGGRGATTTLVGTLENGGVGLAPYHDTEKQIPASTRQEIAEILRSIREGSLDTSGRIP